jgi:hypothetical protein
MAGLVRPSTPSLSQSKAWMPGTRPGMTVEIDASDVGNVSRQNFCEATIVI